MKKPSVCISPLDWGLGHATRCISLLKAFESLDYQIYIATEGYHETILKEAIPTPGVVPTQNNNGQDVNKLTATVSSLQKQIQDLQKAALQQTAQTKIGSPTSIQQAAQPILGAIPQSSAQQLLNQPQLTKGTVGSAAQQQSPATAQGQAKTPVGQPNGQPMGQKPVVPQQPNPVAKQTPGVNQSPQITNLNIKQALTKNQGGGH